MIEQVIERAKISAPGCYGAISCFKHTSDTCKVCPHFGDCEVKVAEKLKSMAKKVDLSDFIIRHDSASMLAGIPIVHESNVKIETKKPIKRTQPVKKVARIYTDEEKGILESLPVKVAVIGKQVIDSGLSRIALKELLGGSNPFPYDGKRFLHLACKLLLVNGFTRQELKALYLENGMSSGTAASHVSMAVALFKAFGIAVENSNKITLNKGTL
jgi:hypothetical protein